MQKINPINEEKFFESGWGKKTDTFLYEQVYFSS